MTYPIPGNEQNRLNALYDYDILDSISEDEYDSITRIAAQICNVPASLITFLDKDRQWFKSHLGIDITETPRAISFCNYTIMEPSDILVVPDLRADERFAQNPMVTNAPNAVFYAGAPLVTPDGFPLGSICVLDAKVNDLDEDQKDALKGLAKQVITMLELRKKIKELKTAEDQLMNANLKLQNFAAIVSHDMKTPLANILLVSRSFKKKYEARLDEQAGDFLNLIDESAKELLVFIDEMFVRSKMIAAHPEELQTIPALTKEIIENVLRMIAVPDDIKVNIKTTLPDILLDKILVQQVFQNLITNAIKYNDKKEGVINISCETGEAFCCFNIADNGSGIPEKYLSRVFEKGLTLNKTDRFGNKGTGFGLAAVKDLLEDAGASVSVSSKECEGTVFTVSLPLRLVAV